METLSILIIVSGLALATLIAAISEFLRRVVKQRDETLAYFHRVLEIEASHQVNNEPESTADGNLSECRQDGS